MRTGSHTNDEGHHDGARPWVLVVNQHGDNRGDEAALRAMLGGIEARLGPTRFTVVHQFADPTTTLDLPFDVEWLPMRLRVPDAVRLLAYGATRALGRATPSVAGPLGRRIAEAYQGCDLVVSAPGGPYFGDLYKDHEPVHWYFTWLARLHGKPSILYAPSAGPFRFRPWNPLRRLTYGLLDVVTTREERSARHVRDLMGPDFPIEVTADSALQERVAPPAAPSPPTLAVSALRWGYPGDPDPDGRRRSYDDAVVAAIERVVERRPGTRVVFLPQLHGTRHRDAPYLRSLAEALPPTFDVEVLDDEADSDTHRRVVAGADMVIAGRYHPAVFAISAGVPVLCIPYEHKAAGVMEAAGLEEHVVPIEDVDPTTLADAAERVLAESSAIRARLASSGPALAARAGRTSDLAAGLLTDPRRLAGRRALVVGTFDPHFGRNRQVVRLLGRAGWAVTTRPVPLWSADRTSDFQGNRARMAARVLRAGVRTAAAFLAAPTPELVVVLHPGLLDAIVLAPLARRRGVPLVLDQFVSLHDTAVGDRALVDPRSATARATALVDRLATRAADLVLADTPHHAEHHASVAGCDTDSIGVLRIGGDPDLYPQVTSPPDDPRLVTFYGTYVPLQGTATIVRAAAALKDADVRVTMVGTGQDRAEVEDLARAEGAPVEFVDWLPEPELSAFMASGAVCLGVFGTSAKAGRVVPNKVLGALMTGRPCITADTAAVREELGDAVLTVPPGDADALAAAILELLDDPERAASLGARGRRRYDELYADDVQAGRLSVLLDGLLGDRATSRTG